MFYDENAQRLAAAAIQRLDASLAGLTTAAAGATADPYAGAITNILGPHYNKPALIPGVIVDFVGGLHAYRVNLGEQSYVWAALGGLDSGTSILGARPVSTLPIGSKVWVLRDPDTPDRATIMAREPTPSIHRVRQPSDTWWPIFRSGHSADSAHRRIPAESAAAGAAQSDPVAGVDLIDFGGGRPLDSIAVGEWGAFMETAVGVGADPFHAFIRVDESTGVFGFYQDSLLRITGKNFQQWTSITETEELEDQGELRSVKQGWVYPGELWGLWRHNQITSRTSTGAGRQGVITNNSDLVQGGAGVAVREPEHFAQMAAARWWEYGGYLGQGGKRIVGLPLQYARYYPAAIAHINATATVTASGDVKLNGSNPSATAVVPPANRVLPEGDAVTREANNYGDYVNRNPYLQPGVLEETKTLTGAWYVRTAKAAALVKRAAIPTPRQRVRPEDPAGDAPGADYAPSGLSNGTQQHFVTDEPTASLGTRQRIASLHDVMAYTFNWESLHPFAYHQKDWHTPEEIDAAASISPNSTSGWRLYNQVVPNYAYLVCDQHLRTPDPLYMEVDHRYGAIAYYPNESGLVLLHDGSTAFYDGWGSERRSYSGIIEETAAGDIILRSGRNIILMAGHDVIIRAKDSVDVSSSCKDVRIKADRNLHMLAGASGCGGALIESQAICPGYGFTNNVGEEVNSSGVVLLARSSQVWAHGNDVVLTAEGDEPRIILNPTDKGTIRYDAHQHQFVMRRDGVCDGVMVHLFSNGGSGFVAANEFGATHTIIGPSLYAFAVTGSTTARNNANARIEHLKNSYGPLLNQSPPTPTGASDAEFTTRNPEQYLTDAGNYEIWEARWQTMARKSNQTTLPKWSEPSVVSTVSGTVGYPYPGIAWTQNTMLLINPRYVNPDDGWAAVPRRESGGGAIKSMYESPALNLPSYAAPENAYIVTVACGNNCTAELNTEMDNELTELINELRTQQTVEFTELIGNPSYFLDLLNP